MTTAMAEKPISEKASPARPLGAERGEALKLAVLILLEKASSD
jgi:hypothetical protein